MICNTKKAVLHGEHGELAYTLMPVAQKTNSHVCLEKTRQCSFSLFVIGLNSLLRDSEFFDGAATFGRSCKVCRNT